MNTSSAPITNLNIVRKLSVSRTIVVLFAMLIGHTLAVLYGQGRMETEYNRGVSDTQKCMDRPVVFVQRVQIININVYEQHVWVLP